MRRTIATTAASVLAAGTIATLGVAQAAPVTGGTTVVEVTADLAALGVTAAPTGTTVVPGSAPVFQIEITGGDIDQATLAGQILHESGGIDLTAGTTVIALTDFIIDTTVSQLFGTVTVDGSLLGSVALFDFDVSSLSDPEDLFDLGDPMLSLVFTTGAGAALAPILGVDLAGAVFGVAATAPALGDADVVPLPGAALLFVTGAVGLAARRRMSA